MKKISLIPVLEIILAAAVTGLILNGCSKVSDLLSSSGSTLNLNANPHIATLDNSYLDGQKDDLAKVPVNGVTYTIHLNSKLH